MTSDARPSHVGVAVSDLDRAENFYKNAFGFERINAASATKAFNSLLELPEASTLEIRIIGKGSFVLELLAFHPPVQAGGKRRMDSVGFTHMAMAVDALEPQIKLVEAAGGNAHRETYLKNAIGEFIFCTDLDGVRIELMCFATTASVNELVNTKKGA